MTILSVQALSKSFTHGFWPFQKRISRRIVDGISFTVNPGEIVGFLGPNGAGKTTTIQMLLGAMTPSSGTIHYFGMPFNQANRLTILSQIGYASGYEKLPARLLVWENLDIIGRIYKIPSQERMLRIRSLLDAFGIAHVYNQETGSLSAGQATRVMLAKAFMAQPALVLLDEPTASLDPEAAYEARQFIMKEQKERNTALLITSHNMAEVSELCDRVIVLKKGSIIANATPESLAQSIAKIHVHLVIDHGMDALITYLTQKRIAYTLTEHEIEIQIDEDQVAQFFMQLAQQNITYRAIAIDKPSLEDYFMSIAKK